MYMYVNMYASIQILACKYVNTDISLGGWIKSCPVYYHLLPQSYLAIQCCLGFLCLLRRREWERVRMYMQIIEEVERKERRVAQSITQSSSLVPKCRSGNLASNHVNHRKAKSSIIPKIIKSFI